MTCLFDGEWKNAGPNVLIIIVIACAAMHVCCCCCFLVSYRQKFVERWVAFKEQELGLKSAEDEFTAMTREDFLRVAPEYWKNQDLTKNFDGRHPPSPETK